MKIYVKDNVERIAGDEESAKKLEAKGYKAIKGGEPVIPEIVPKAPEPTHEATAVVQRRRRSQRKTVL